MAKEVTVTTRCDECGKDDGTEEFTVIRDGKPHDVDLCEVHAAPLIKLYELGTEAKPAPKAKPKRGGRAAHAVIPIEDYEGQ